MTIEEAIGHLRNMKMPHDKFYEETDEINKTLIDKGNEALDMAIKALEQTQWIPVSERLPEEDGCYLVTTTGTNNDIIDIAYYTDGIWHKASRIKAWQPLPQPYKEEGGDKE